MNLKKEMISDMAQQEAIFRPTPFWERALHKIGDELSEDALANFRRLPGAKQCFVPTYQLESLSYYGREAVNAVREVLPDQAKSQKGAALFEWLSTGAYLATSDYRAYRAGDRIDCAPDLSQCSESTLGNPDEQWEFEGKFYSRSMLNYLNGLVFLKQNVDTSGIERVIEIGGGFGTLGEILFQDSSRDYAYVDIDIPPAAYAASYYLNAIYSGAKFVDYKAAKTRGALNAEELLGCAAVICPWQLEKLQGSFDLFVNFISFQEMEPEVVEHYLDHMKRLECKFALIRNLREGKPKRSEARPWGVDHPILSQDYDRMFADRGYRLVADNVYPFGFKTVDGFHSELRLYQRSQA
jgi:putative sugar O-methyltransferase